LWALETLAWDPTLLPRVAHILARLAAIDPGGRLVNRPINSLRSIFISWEPNTNATLRQRLAALDNIIGRVPEVAWHLLTLLLPKQHDSSAPTSKPRFREAGEAERETLTYGLVWQSQREIVSRALQLVGEDADRLVTIIDGMDNFEPELRSRALSSIDRFLASAPTATARQKVWSSLRDLENRHKEFSDAEWALPEEELRNLTALVSKYEPHNPVQRYTWLFDDWLPHVEGRRR
jgi:hypothetical protein